MKVLYFIQTYKNLPQIIRLATTIKHSSPHSVVLVSQNRDSFAIDPAVFRHLPDVYVTHVSNINRADFSVMQAHLDGIAYVRQQGIEFDWIVNMSGQCYPTRPLAEFEQMLAATAYDGFMDFYEAFVPSDHNPWNRHETSGRYNYQYHVRLMTGGIPTTLRKALSIPRRIINNIQPFIRVDTSYGLQLGTRSWRPMFNDQFKLYGGSYFKTLSRKALDYFYNFTQSRRDITDYFRRTSIPDEVFPQTILLNNPHLSFCNDSLYYIKWAGGRLGSPADLITSDYSTIVERNTFFARKFDPALDSRILDMLDARVVGAVETTPHPLATVA
jgi:hypothetical protein